MIVVPIVLTVVAHHALIGAGRGALMGAITGTIGGAITSAREEDTIRGVIVGAASAGVKGAVQGAKVGAVFGAIGGVGHAIHSGRSAWLARNYQSLSKGTHPKGYVYLIQDTSNPGRYKIGRTINPVQRLQQIQRGEAGKLHYHFIRQTDNAPALERLWHQKFASSRMQGEWFSLSGRQIREICKVGGYQRRLQQVADLAGAVGSSSAGRQRRRHHRHHPERKAKRKVIANKIEAELKAEWEAKRRAEAERKEAEAEHRKTERRAEAEHRKAEAERRKTERRAKAERKKAEAEYRKSQAQSRSQTQSRSIRLEPNTRRMVRLRRRANKRNPQNVKALRPSLCPLW